MTPGLPSESLDELPPDHNRQLFFTEREDIGRALGLCIEDDLQVSLSSLTTVEVTGILSKALLNLDVLIDFRPERCDVNQYRTLGAMTMSKQFWYYPIIINPFKEYNSYNLTARLRQQFDTLPGAEVLTSILKDPLGP